MKLCIEAVKTGQKILTEQQESMSEEEKGLKKKEKERRHSVIRLTRRSKYTASLWLA